MLTVALSDIWTVIDLRRASEHVWPDRDPSINAKILKSGQACFKALASKMPPEETKLLHEAFNQGASSLIGKFTEIFRLEFGSAEISSDESYALMTYMGFDVTTPAAETQSCNNELFDRNLTARPRCNKFGARFTSLSADTSKILCKWPFCENLPTDHSYRTDSSSQRFKELVAAGKFTPCTKCIATRKGLINIVVAEALPFRDKALKNDRQGVTSLSLDSRVALLWQCLKIENSEKATEFEAANAALPKKKPEELLAIVEEGDTRAEIALLALGLTHPVVLQFLRVHPHRGEVQKALIELCNQGNFEEIRKFEKRGVFIPKDVWIKSTMKFNGLKDDSGLKDEWESKYRDFLRS